MKIRYTKFILCVFLLISGSAFAKVILPAVIGNNMVLQQNKQVPLWGKARVNAKVTIVTSWNHKLYTVWAKKDSTWRLLVQTPKAGGPYEVSFNDGQSLVLKNILIGEVWVCSGQSNMEMPVKGFGNQPVLNSSDLLLDAENSNIRLFRLERASSRSPQNDCKATPWEEANAQSVKDFSAVGYMYAKILQEKLKVPVGVIMSVWGGTMVEAWMDQASLKEFPEIKMAPDTAKVINKNDPTVLFNAMINPVVGYGIKGVIWYQGEQNRINYQQYDRLLAAMVNEWRKIWQMGEWPFYYVQIAPYTYTLKDKQGLAAYLREAQQKAMAEIPNSGMAVTMDLGSEKSIHPPDKLPISKRLAYWALANTYGKKGLNYQSPVYKSMKVTASNAFINFDATPNGLTSFGKDLLAFEIAGDDRVYYPAKAKITGNGVTVQSEKVKTPVAVRYGFKDWIVGDLYNTEGLPVTPFRTDNW
ncbi:sialate O-acetylesterase [Mucilaginibacter sp.]|jgi:sialate O-acetylesterase|uniref:sialate O-acetylesterase n=1 Tax=Mucilaginibacter sp. TaxID=1882438 RepID=UPI003563BA37